jgi:hypothetical protein
VVGDRVRAMEWWKRAGAAVMSIAWVAALGGVATPVRAAGATGASAVSSEASELAVAGSASGGPGVSGSAGEANVQIPPPAPGTQVMADDGVLRMDMNPSTGWFEIVDKRNGAIWTSGLTGNLRQYAVNQVQQDVLKSQFDMGYTTVARLNEMPRNNQFNQSQSLAQLSVSRIANGVAMTYKFDNGIQFTVDLTLEGDHMIATVPYDQIFERKYTHAGEPQSNQELPIGQAGCPRYPEPPPTMSFQLFWFPPECYQLTSITFLPAFGAGLPGQDGYIVVPDGSGAEIDFSAVHPVYTNDFEMPIYGDATVGPLEDRWLPEDNMPVYGIVHTNRQDPARSSAMLAVVTKGAADAEIDVVPAGQRANVYQASVKFIYRPQFNALEVGMQRQLEYSWKPIPGDRQVVYYFVPGADATYAGLALRYRQYLIDTQHATPLTPQSRPPFLLRVFAGAREVGVPFAPFEAATTFAQAEQMAEWLQRQGVGPIRMSLEGWMFNGYSWNTLPAIWPPDGRLGGVAGLRRLAEWGKAHQVQVVLAADLVHAWSNRNGFNPRADGVHQESQLFLQDAGAFLMSADWVAHTLYPKLQRQMAAVGVTGADFDYLARDLYSNYQPKHTLSREQFAAQWMQMVSTARAKLGTAGVQGGSTYAVGSADYFYNAPTTDSGFNYESAQIPFWEIAVHGLALYSGRESNLMSSPTFEKLQMIMDGALPVWELTWQSASSLRYTYYNVLYSSQFSQWAPLAVQEYKQEVDRGYARLAYVAITGSEQVQPGVNVTDYADGSHVIVNFNDKPVTLSQYGNVVVPAEDYVVVSGGAGR